MFDEPKLFPAILLGLLAVVCVIPAWENRDWPEAWRVALVTLGALFFFFAFLMAIDWVIVHIGGHWSDLLMERSRAAAITSDGEILRLMAALQPYQVEAWLRRSTTLIGTPGVAGPTYSFDVDGTSIPIEFVEDFLAGCGDEQLVPVRSWSEGTSGRQWAVALTRFFVQRGLAHPAVANLPARWTYGREAALAWFGVNDGDSGTSLQNIQ